MEDYINSRQLTVSIHVNYHVKTNAIISYNPLSGDYTILFRRGDDYGDDPDEIFEILFFDENNLLYFLRTLLSIGDDLLIKLNDGDRELITSMYDSVLEYCESHGIDRNELNLDDRKKFYRGRRQAFNKKVGRFLGMLKSSKGITPNAEAKNKMNPK